MGKEKAGFLTPKSISNRIKARGLQKLRWYCQMCQKQCRDENGFKCHTMSESHQRQLLLVADNPSKFVDTFSKEFCDTFVELLRRRFGTKRVHGNVVYQEYIADRHHVHMNSTRWVTLTGFIKWLGKKGLCIVDETEKGWFIQYVDRTPEAIQRQAALEKKIKMDLDDEDKRRKMVEEQVERAKMERRKRKRKREGEENQDGEESEEEEEEEDEEEDEEEEEENEEEENEIKKEFKKINEDEKIAFKIPVAIDTTKVNNLTTKSAFEAIRSTKPFNDTASTSSKIFKSKQNENNNKKKTNIEEIIEMEENKKAKIGRKDYWLVEGIVVKVTTKKAGEQYYKKKAVVKEVVEKYGAIIKIIDTGDKIKLDQIYLETVIPSIGKKVLIVNGAYRGCQATLKSLQEAIFSCTVTIEAGPLRGRTLSGIQYEDICKIHDT